MKLVLLIYKAGQLSNDDTTDTVYLLLQGLTEVQGATGGSSDPNYRVGVLRRDPHYANGFGTTGFLPKYHEDTPGSENQVRHFIGWFAAGYLVPGRIAANRLYEAEGTSDLNNPDVALGIKGIGMGNKFGFGNSVWGVAQGVWRTICGGESNLDLRYR